MALVYFDASALVKLCVPEPGSELASALWNRADLVVTSRLADVELRAALAAGLRAGVLDAAAHDRAVARWEELWPALHRVEVTAELADQAAALAAGTDPLRGADAVHVAGAIAVMRDGGILAAWDERVATAARSHGLRVLP
ncbi:type II toxin-antitoxin system VapC family toxin [Isoptericola sediminis]|uniref:Ribonuclease VapC n=1 Tax=Isoptericola sediminis TaxID=2733572 RepID=A0A849JZ78_9MICO|nr:type II toxin-antitoxin system VapC family toxin [Isoptericola sediminis]NNU26098.1 type II toxin-antitoxin system VapC family toxin [Isoptericola sediminis]